MHYIVGTKIIVNINPQAQHAAGPRSVGAAPVQRRLNTENFKPGSEYTLHYIRKREKNFLYTFKDSTTGETFFMTFESTLDADSFIAKLLGEKLPDYKSHYENQGN